MAITDFFKSNQGSIQIPDNEPTLPPPVTASSPMNFQWNPFKNYTNNNNIRLPTEPEEEIINNVTNDPGMFHLSMTDRLMVFGIFFIGSIVCYLICIFMFPILSLKPRKFISLWTLGSVFFITSFCFLQGFGNFMSLDNGNQKLVIKLSALGSIGMTLYSSLVLKSTLLAIIFAVFQLISQLYYSASYFPFGTTTLNWTGRIAYNQAENWINS